MSCALCFACKALLSGVLFSRLPSLEWLATSLQRCPPRGAPVLQNSTHWTSVEVDARGAREDRSIAGQYANSLWKNKEAGHMYRMGEIEVVSTHGEG